MNEITGQTRVRTVAGMDETQKRRDSTAIARSYLRDVPREIHPQNARVLVMLVALLGPRRSGTGFRDDALMRC